MRVEKEHIHIEGLWYNGDCRTTLWGDGPVPAGFSRSLVGGLRFIDDRHHNWRRGRASISSAALPNSYLRPYFPSSEYVKCWPSLTYLLKAKETFRLVSFSSDFFIWMKSSSRDNSPAFKASNASAGMLFPRKPFLRPRPFDGAPLPFNAASASFLRRSTSSASRTPSSSLAISTRSSMIHSES